MSNCCNDLSPIGHADVDIIHISRGFNRRALLKGMAGAAGLALQPKLLLMDEPFASLDAIVRHYLTEDLCWASSWA